MILPGEIYMADLAGAGPHPLIVVSRDTLNRGKYVVGVACTSARFDIRSKLLNCVPFQAGEFGFTVDCVAKCESIFAVDQTILDLSAGPIGILDDMALREVIKAIGYVTASDCEPD